MRLAGMIPKERKTIDTQGKHVALRRRSSSSLATPTATAQDSVAAHHLATAGSKTLTATTMTTPQCTATKAITTTWEARAKQSIGVVAKRMDITTTTTTMKRAARWSVMAGSRRTTTGMTMVRVWRLRPLLPRGPRRDLLQAGGRWLLDLHLSSAAVARHELLPQLLRRRAQGEAEVARRLLLRQRRLRTIELLLDDARGSRKGERSTAGRRGAGRRRRRRTIQHFLTPMIPFFDLALLWRDLT